MKKLTTIMMMLAMILLLISCDNVFKEKYKVQFRNGNDTILEQEVIAGSKLEEPENIENAGFINEGWFTNLKDETTEWNFNEDVVKSHLILHVKWTKDDRFTNITNIKLEDGIISFDEVEGSVYEFSFNDKVVQTTVPNINLNSYTENLGNFNKITIKALLEGKQSIASDVKVQYSQSEEVELLTMDFEDFTKTGYAESIIEYNSYRFRSANSLITTHASDNKNDKRAIRFDDNGFFEFILPVEDFHEMSFYLGDFISDSGKDAKLTISYRYDLESNWNLLKEYTSKANLTKYQVSSDDLVDFDSSKLVYFNFQKDGRKNAKVNVDDIYITTKTDTEFIMLENDLIDLSPYYKSIEGLSGKDLINELNFILSTNLKDVKYSHLKEILEVADASLEDETKVVGIYNQVLYRANWGSKSEWHREHVWPNSRLAIDRVKESEVNQGSDPHNLRAINPSVNSSRSNRYYSEALDNSKLGHTTKTGAYYPGDVDKGDVARILLYMVIRYDQEGLILTSNEKLLKEAKAYTKEGAVMGKLDLLYNWHLEDPVDEFEINRNNIIYNYQGNRNPFIDHPELFEEVFNYYVNLDTGRLINLNIVIDYSLDYGDFKKDNLALFS